MEYDSKLLDKSWRMKNFYYISDKEGKKVLFERNEAQNDFNQKKHSRNIILKSRQLGFTTDESIDMFDDCLFTRNFSGLLISYDKESALDIFTNKIDYAWRSFPNDLRVLYKVDAERKNMLRFDFQDGTFSNISVRTSGRSATHNRVHISEFAKICKTRPDKANEIMTGTIPAVPMGGRLDIESTAEGAKGEFYDMFWDAWNRQGDKNDYELSPTEYKAFFYNWTWDKKEISQIVSKNQNLPRDFLAYQKDYNLSDIEITYYYYKFQALNKNWDRLHQEYPTTPKEAFESSLQGSYYFDYISEMRAGGRILSIPIERGLPVHTYWDLGMNDTTVILFFQVVRNEWRLIDYYENSGKGLEHYIKVLQDKGYIYASHTAPHDIRVRELSTGESRWEAARKLGISFKIAPKLPINDGIDAVRRKFNLLWVDKDRCDTWIKHISNYRKEWNERIGIWENKPFHDDSSHAADATRIWAITSGTQPLDNFTKERKKRFKREKKKRNTGYSFRMSGY